VTTLSLPANVMALLLGLPHHAHRFARDLWLTESLFPKKSALLSRSAGGIRARAARFG